MSNSLPSYIKAVIFDVDGLLIDSEPIWQKTREAFIAKYAAKKNETIDHKRFIGMGMREEIEILKQQLTIESEIGKLMSEFRDIFYTQALQGNILTLMEGAQELIASLYPRMPLAIATGGHSKEMARSILKKLHVIHFFKIIISSDDVKQGKPHPDVFLAAAAQLHVKPEVCLVLEDSVNGVLAGKAAEMFVIGVNKDEKIYQELQKAGADFVVRSLLEVI